MGRRLPLRIALAVAAFSVPACGSRTGLLMDGILSDGLSTLDASVLTDAADASDSSDASTDAPIVIPQAFQCPHDPLDVCGDKAYQPGSPWPTFQRCSSHTGRTEAIGPSNPVLLWGTPSGASVLSPPSVAADGTVYYTGSGALVATSAAGAPIFNEQSADVNAGQSTGAIGPDGTIYFALDRVYAYAPDGTFKWSSYTLTTAGTSSAYQTLASPGSSITLGPCGTLFVGSQSGLHIMDGQGNTIWDSPEQGLTPAVDPNGSAYYGTSDGRLLAVNPDGTTRWTFTLPNADGGTLLWTQPAPVLGPDGTIYFGEIAGFHAIGADGKEKWFLPWGVDGGDPLVGAALAADGTVYVAFPDNTLRAITPDGKIKWSVDVEVFGTSPIIDGHGTIYELGTDGVFAITPEGQVAWAITLPGAISEDGTLAMGADGTIYASTQGLYAIGNAK